MYRLGVCAIAADHSFDVVSRVDMAEVQNAVNQAVKEVATRFDFRGSKAQLELDAKSQTVVLTAEDGHQLRSLLELLQQRLVKRGVSLRSLETGKPEPAGGDTLKQKIVCQQGIPTEKAREMSRLLRDSKLKVTSQIQDDQLRVTAPKKDDLQAAIALLKQNDFGIELQFVNYR